VPFNSKPKLFPHPISSYFLIFPTCIIFILEFISHPSFNHKTERKIQKLTLERFSLSTSTFPHCGFTAKVFSSIHFRCSSCHLHNNNLNFRIYIAKLIIIIVLIRFVEPSFKTSLKKKQHFNSSE
jgi:hypothetical protein